MKIKSFALVLTSVALLASCGGQSSSATGLSTPPTETSSASQSSMLNFIPNGKIYFDVQETDIRFSYGNAALQVGKNEIAFDASAKLSCSGNPAQVYNFIYVYESLGGYGKTIALGIEPESVVEYLSDDRSEFTGKTRLFVAISSGDKAKWTRGLNADLDAQLDIWTGGQPN